MVSHDAAFFLAADSWYPNGHDFLFLGALQKSMYILAGFQCQG
jgi:hypothetical protein